ncbi:sodium/proline symporter [Reichenbachiella agariperforans]|uniref:sodium/proline symporter n=1 Tax=Reichenbachiella agariperforans TaxID=156994 RepID=UPI001C09FE31|nr:sodium/proline symporter [Reichenbachiella agariperforans]MBU2915388.1 sodium/proline symporter [Reichenbachiella agariperforans]
MIVVFVLMLLLFAGIGVGSSIQKQKNTKDYLLAGQDVKPWLVALSAVATNNSGYMFIGMIGYTYVAGLESVWLMVGWILGDFMGSMLVYGKLRDLSAKYNILSFGSLIANHEGKIIKSIRLLSGLISFVFLSTYAAAQFSAGGKALAVTLHWDQWIGVVSGAVLVLLYCFSGGIRASIWTDAAQSIVMFIAMGTLLYYAVDYSGGWTETISSLREVKVGYMSLFNPEISLSASLLVAVGWLFAGFGVVGQPHIMVRYMTLDSTKNIKKVRMYYYSWFTGFYALAIGVGLLSRIVLTGEGDFDPELALPMMSMRLLPDYLVGIMLAGIFAATISTADSLVISCTSSLSNDIFPQFKNSYRISKLFTIGITLFAVGISLYGHSSVFEIVIYAWAVLGTVFGPVITMRMLNKPVNANTTLAMMISAGVVTLGWNFIGWGSIVYEMMPGIITGFVVYFISRIGAKSQDN